MARQHARMVQQTEGGPWDVYAGRDGPMVGVISQRAPVYLTDLHEVYEGEAFTGDAGSTYCERETLEDAFAFVRDHYETD